MNRVRIAMACGAVAALLPIWADAQQPANVTPRAPSPPALSSIQAHSTQAALESIPAGQMQVDLPAEPTGRLALDEVRETALRMYPLLASAILQRGVAGGENLSAQGAFDLSIDASNETGALGFYKTNRAQLTASQPLWYGGKAYSGYRIGRGNFEPWYLERQTNKGGEFRTGVTQPLLQNLQTDKRRTQLQKTAIAQQAVEPDIDRQRIAVLLAASEKYWNWVSAGHNHRIAQDLLTIAQQRAVSIGDAVRAGRIAEIEQVDNQRLIVSRQTKLIQADRKFLQTAIELSMYYRHFDTGDPIVPTADRLTAFPEPAMPQSQLVDSDIALALSQRPELRYTRLQRQKTTVELQWARNQLLPTLETGMFAAQDVGDPTPKGDKTPFQLEAGVFFDVPLQRRNAQGQVRAYEAQLGQIAAQERYYVDRISTDVRYAMAGLSTAYNELIRARESVVLAEQMETAERDKFMAGTSNILFVNLREVATAETRLLVIDALENYHLAYAEYWAALGLDAAN